jgi:hypothetical protein
MDDHPGRCHDHSRFNRRSWRPTRSCEVTARCCTQTRRLAHGNGASALVKNCMQAQALADPNIHAAMCASTTSTHEGIIRACFEHKKPCFTEKPVGE